jgi:putative lipoic acid-binding regulatory protein
VSDLPTIELLESTHTFPGVYMFKVIGRTEGAFAARVVAAAREALHWDVDPPFRVREAAGGRHVAVTLEPHLASAHEVLTVYRRLRDTTGLVMCL